MNHFPDQFPDHPESDPNGPTPEQLRVGYELGPDEKVAVGFRKDGFARVNKFNFPGIDPVIGTPLAVIDVGGDDIHANAYVFELDRDREYKKVAVLEPKDGLAQLMPLNIGESWGIGRGFDGQSNLPDTVSRDHCTIGLDDEGNFLVENHNPTNFTRIKVLTKQFDQVTS